MDILVSFCNVQTPGRPLLALLDTDGLGLRVVKLPASVGAANGVTGIVATDELLFALVSRPGGQGGSVERTPASLVVFDRANLQVVRQHPLHGLSDVRGLA